MRRDNKCGVMKKNLLQGLTWTTGHPDTIGDPSCWSISMTWLRILILIGDTQFWCLDLKWLLGVTRPLIFRVWRERLCIATHGILVITVTSWHTSEGCLNFPQPQKDCLSVDNLMIPCQWTLKWRNWKTQRDRKQLFHLQVHLLEDYNRRRRRSRCNLLWSSLPIVDPLKMFWSNKSGLWDCIARKFGREKV